MSQTMQTSAQPQANPAKTKKNVQHPYDVGPTSKTLGRHLGGGGVREGRTTPPPPPPVTTKLKIYPSKHPPEFTIFHQFAVAAKN